MDDRIFGLILISSNSTKAGLNNRPPLVADATCGAASKIDREGFAPETKGKLESRIVGALRTLLTRRRSHAAFSATAFRSRDKLTAAICLQKFPRLLRGFPCSRCQASSLSFE